MKKLQIVVLLLFVLVSFSMLASIYVKGCESGPSVTVSPKSWTMEMGQSKTFTANPSGGSGTYSSYKWYVDSALQSGQTASTFSYSPASLGSHLITVTVTDSSGATSAMSAAATVTVYSVPTVTVSPASWIMDAGQSKTFSANPSGGSGTYLSYQWYVDGYLSLARLHQRLILLLLPRVLT